MDLILTFIKLHLAQSLIYFVIVLLAFVALYFLSKHKSKSDIVLQALVVIRTFMFASLGSKAAELIDIWIEGIKMIQDGEFSQEDGIDQFVRYVHLAASSKGVSLSENELEAIKNLAETTLKTFMNKKKSEVQAAVKTFQAMDYK